MQTLLTDTGRRLRAFQQTDAWTYCLYAVIALLIIASGFELYDFIRRLAVEFHGISIDFLMTGRAALNGYVPYADHLDVKAPGTIVLGALSLLLTGDGRFLFAFKIVILLAIPVLIMVMTMRETRTLDRLRRTILTFSAFLLGSELSLYVMERGGNNSSNAEPFGVFFALLYLLVIAWDRRKMSYLRLGLASFFLLCTIGIKEPFLFVLLAMNLLLARDVRFFIRSFVAPLGIAAVTGIIVLTVLGYLSAYVTVGLGTILTDRIAGENSVFFRGLMVFNVYDAVTTYSHTGPVMGYVLATLLVLRPFPASGGKRRTELLAGATLLALLYSLYVTGFYGVVLGQLQYAFPFDNAAFLWLTVRCAGALALLVLLLLAVARFSPRLIIGIGLTGIAVYLVTFAIGSGDFLAQQYLLAVPFYAAAFLVFAERPRAFLIPVIFLIFMPFHHVKPDYAAKAAAANQFAANSSLWIPAAEQLDAMMDACAIDRYSAFGGPSNIVVRTHHSPMDHSYPQQSKHPDMRKRFLERLAASPVIFVDEEYLSTVEDAEVRSILQTNFTRNILTCAQGKIPQGVIVLFNAVTQP
ncbi:MAG: hypothetical protein HOO67_05060 [Candidatus Peribacteraceae bacterium]|nr:hypothetical protein [Candidatus Peribacteraceae bacterium]